MAYHNSLRLGDLPFLAASRWGKREAFCFEGKRWGFDALAAEVESCAKGLIGIGVQPGERVGVWMTNRPEWLFLMYGIARIGATLVPLNSRYRVDDLAAAVAQSRCATLIALARSGPVDYETMLGKALPDLSTGRVDALRLSRFPELRRLVVVGETDLPNVIPWTSLPTEGAMVSDTVLAERVTAVRPTDTMAIFYTSGTTGEPKGAVHDHSGIRNTLKRTRLYELSERDVHMSYLPFFYLYGFSETAMAALLTGSRQVLMETFDADAVLDLAEREQATIFHGFHGHWVDLLKAQEARPRRLAWRFGSYPSGSETSAAIARRVQGAFGPTVSGWGMSETWCFVTCNRLTDSAEQRTDASGYPMNGYQLRIVDPETGVDADPEGQGELLVRGYAQMKGYFDKPEETAEVIDADGWVHTGDVARIRADGHMVFMGRYKDMLKVGGENVSPAEIEARLLGLDGVRDAAVVGVPDERLDEVVIAFLVTDPRAGLTEGHVIASCQGRIASFKIPRHIFFLDKLPMTPLGKVRKVELREMACDMRQSLASAS